MCQQEVDKQIRSIADLIKKQDDRPTPTYDDVANDLYEVYAAHRRAGFSRKQSFELTKLSIEIFM